MHCQKFKTITSKDNFDINLFVIQIEVPKLILAKCEIFELRVINLKFLNFISYINCMSATNAFIERASKILGYIIGSRRTQL
jgi:hypothetical protein